jgi:hypothetical protein
MFEDKLGVMSERQFFSSSSLDTASFELVNHFLQHTLYISLSRFDITQQ